MKKTRLLIICILFTGSIIGQTTVNFGYDAAGNRISRTIDMGKSVDSTGQKADSIFVKATETDENVPTKYNARVGGQTIKIYPNPTTGVFAIIIDGWDNKSKASIQLTSLTGKGLIKIRIESSVTKIDIKGQPNGTYLLLVNLNGKKETWKVVKK
jgi:hypothetical protein